MGIYWYMFVEMFEHFREFFTWVFQLLIFILVVGLTLKFSHNPLYICLIASLLMNVLQPYHSIGQLGLLISILPVWNHILKHLLNAQGKYDYYLRVGDKFKLSTGEELKLIQE
ncbi:unnamed protein product [Trichobilharzia regenti]|nr:unnamed protein product [Trichobilharzia regenti]